MNKILSENELRQICRSLAARLNLILKDADTIKANDSRMDETGIVLRSLLREIRRASGIDLNANIYYTNPAKHADAYWYEIQRTLTGFQQDAMVDYDYRAIIQEELLDKIPSAS